MNIKLVERTPEREGRLRDLAATIDKALTEFGTLANAIYGSRYRYKFTRLTYRVNELLSIIN